MFKRAIQVRLVKTAKKTETESSQTDELFESKVASIGTNLQKAVKEAGKFVIIYVAADTVRRVAIEIAKK